MHKEHAQAFFNSMYFLAEAEKNKDSSRPFKEIVGEYIKELQQHQPSLIQFSFMNQGVLLAFMYFAFS